MPFIFVAGNSRSGTTMMGRILNNHGKVYTFTELHFFEQLWSGAEQNKILPDAEAIKLCALLLNIAREGYFAKRHTHDFEAEAQQMIRSMAKDEITSLKVFAAVLRTEAKRNDKEYPCDQTPQNIFYIREILTAFPDSYFINMVRDPRDVLLSQKRKWKRRFLGGTHATWFETIRAWTNYHPITISKLWNASVNAGSKIEDRRVMRVKFEELLAEPDKTIERICYFLGLHFTPELKNVPQVGSSSGADKKDVKGINAGRSQSHERGGLTRAEIWLCQRVCSSNMGKLNYAQTMVAPDYFEVAFLYFIFPFKLALALLLNIHRMKNIGETIRKRLSA